MQKRLLLSAIFCFACFSFVGCGGQEGGLAIESGDMTIEEYDQMLKEQEGNMAPPEDAR